MKAQKQRLEDHHLDFSTEKMSQSRNVTGHLQQGKSTLLKQQLAQSDVEVVRRGLEHLKARNERIEALKVQVNAGAYQMDSASIAQKMVGSSLARKMLDSGRYTMPGFKDEE